MTSDDDVFENNRMLRYLVLYFWACISNPVLS